MTVCLDYQPAVEQGAGVGRYTRLLAAHLARLAMPEDRLRLFHLDFRHRQAEIPEGAEGVPWRWLPGRVLQRLWRHAGWPPFEALAGAADLYHFTNFLMPPLRRGPGVVTLFDMSFERFPLFAEDRNLRHLRAGIARTVERAAAIITISEFSASEIAALLPEAQGKLHPIPLGISPAFTRPPATEIDALRRRLGLERPYLLHVGTVEPRKNLPLLIEMFERLADPELELVIAGMAGWKCEPILERMRSSPRSDRIRYLRYVPDGGLAALYAGATLFVVPSFYEGFGFPPLEAMACGTPVLSSCGGSLPEVLGPAATFVEGFDPSAWVAATERLLHDSEARAAGVQAGRAQAARYRWETTAERTWALYRRLSPCR